MIGNQGRYSQGRYSQGRYSQSRDNKSIGNNIGKSRAGENQRANKQSEKAVPSSRNRERERRARGSRKYGQAKLKHSKKGVLSCMIAVIIMIALIGLIAIAYASGGTAAGYIGGIGFLAMIFSGVGIYCAIKGFKEREKDYLTCKIGMGFNISFLIGFIAIFCRGLF